MKTFKLGIVIITVTAVTNNMVHIQAYSNDEPNHKELMDIQYLTNCSNKKDNDHNCTLINNSNFLNDSFNKKENYCQLPIRYINATFICKPLREIINILMREIGNYEFKTENKNIRGGKHFINNNESKKMQALCQKYTQFVRRLMLVRKCKPYSKASLSERNVMLKKKLRRKMSDKCRKHYNMSVYYNEDHSLQTSLLDVIFHPNNSIFDPKKLCPLNVMYSTPLPTSAIKHIPIFANRNIFNNTRKSRSINPLEFTSSISNNSKITNILTQFEAYNQDRVLNIVSKSEISKISTPPPVIPTKSERVTHVTNNNNTNIQLPMSSTSSHVSDILPRSFVYKSTLSTQETWRNSQQYNGSKIVFENSTRNEILLESYDSYGNQNNINSSTNQRNRTETSLLGQNYSELENRILLEFKRLYPLKLWESRGLFTPEFLDIINHHWLQFPPPDPVNHYVLGVLYCIIMVVGIAGNALVIFMFVKCRALQTPANILVMNLAVSDFLLLSKLPLFVFNSFHRGPALGYIGCQVFGFIGGLTGTVSITTLTAIALDRYFVIMYPLEPKRKTTHRRARMYALFTWCYGCVFSLPPLLGLKQYVPEGYLTSCSYDYLDLSFANRVYIFSFFTAAWVIPFCIITVCYIGICYAVFVTRNVKQTSGKDSSRHEKTRSEIRLAGVVIGIISLWFAAWTPYAAVSLLGITGNKQYITPLSSMIPALFCKIASCIDPYVYAVTHSRFRMEFKSFIRRVSVKREARRYSSKSQKVWATQSDIVKRTPETEVSSEESNEVEEVIVMVDMQAENTVKDTASHIKELVVGKKQVSFPMSDKDKNKFRPPSWFVAPKPIRDRSTSFRKHFKDKDQK